MTAVFSEAFLRGLFKHPLVGLNLSEDEISETIALLRHGQVYLWGENLYLSYIGRESLK
jgi:hypothetical protein